MTAAVILSLGEAKRGTLEVKGAPAAQRLYAGIEQRGALLGPPDAAVSISVFNDMQCQACAAWHARTVVPLVETYARTGKAKLVYHHFAMGTRARQASFYAAVAAGYQGRQWQYVHMFFANQELALQRGVTRTLMARVAERIPELEIKDWRRDLDNPDSERTLEADAKLALDLRLPAEPAVIVDGPRGRRKLIESPTAAQVEGAVRAVTL
jgi:protein-disulfide isomerase